MLTDKTVFKICCFNAHREHPTSYVRIKTLEGLLRHARRNIQTADIDYISIRIINPLPAKEKTP